MAASIDGHDGLGCIAFDERLCEIEATCVTGFEDIVKADIEERLGVKVVPIQGKVFVFIPFKDVEKLLQLPSIDNLYVVIKRYEEFIYAGEKEEALTQLKGIVPTADWELGLKVWKKYSNYSGIVSPLPKEPQPDAEIKDLNTEQTKNVKEGSDEKADEKVSSNEKRVGDLEGTKTVEAVPVAVSDCSGDGSEKDELQPALKKQVLDVTPTKTGTPPVLSKPFADPTMPFFRATCYRAGMNHSFQSPDVARNFGGAVQDYFGWNVKMKNFDIEVVINVNETSLYVTIALTTESLHRRHLVEFGRCSLRPTIAYGMLKLCEIKTGEMVCDPMCGTGSIPIEAAVNWKNAVHICGDLQKSCIEKTGTNIEKVNEKRKIKTKPQICVGITRWDATKLPLAEGHVDVFITDMPFGKRSGSRTNNTSLYPQLLKEWARVSKPETGRLCLLTQDRTAITKTMSRVGQLWKHRFTKYINIGGIIAGVYLFKRTKSTNYKLEQL